MPGQQARETRSEASVVVAEFIAGKGIVSFLRWTTVIGIMNAFQALVVSNICRYRRRDTEDPRGLS